MEQLVQTFQIFPAVFYLCVALFSLCIGSFINVVVYRLPIMMERQWRCDCRELLIEELKSNVGSESIEEQFNLVKPDSTCPKCSTPIKPWHNIPVVSWLILKGRCAYCTNSISIRYPLVETFTAVLSLAVAYKFGVSWQTVAALLFTWWLIALSLIDLDTMLLPDELNYQLLWGGLLISLLPFQVDMGQAILGAAVGYLSLWSVYWLFKLITGKEGMGYGDFKLLAALGAWLGVSSIPLIILLSSAVGAAVGISLMFIKGRDKDIPIPFGPYLAVAGWIYLLWGQDIQNAYFKLILS
jgi:leader peptidase (prepilin peptidase)/N-methyltransferase